MDQYHLVFVYGTLRKNEGNHHLLTGSKCFARQSWMIGTLIDTGFGYPAVLLEGNNRVYGELYEVSGETLRVLDRLEGYEGPGKHNHYERAEVTVHTDFSRETAFVYYYDDKVTDDLIHMGDWKCHQYLDQEEQLYFAYGSCMDNVRFIEHDMQHLFSNIAGVGKLSDFTLAFTKKSYDGSRADIMESKGNKVEGKLYSITKECFDYLFEREGVHYGTYRPAFVDIELNGDVVKNVLTFVVVHKKKEVAPPSWYAEEILRGAKHFVSEEYYSQLKSKIERLERGELV